jgi:hypothetical protein
MVSPTIPTPTTAVVAGTLDQTDLEKGRVGLGIIDNPLKPDKTYIVFDAIAGNNNLHLDTGSSTTYSINKGDGTVDDSHTDTGGIKVLNYAVSGRYTITINGNFAGIDTSQTTNQSELNKYIEIYGGTNYPTTLVNNSLKNCKKLIGAIFLNVTDIGDNVFFGCDVINNIVALLASNIGINAFSNIGNCKIVLADIVSLINAKTGIGKDIPEADLHIHVNDTSTLKYPIQKWTESSGGILILEISNTGASNPEWTFNSGANEAFVISQNSIERLRVHTDGKIGIGKDIPEADIHLYKFGNVGLDYKMQIWEQSQGGKLALESSDLGASNPEWVFNSGANEAIGFAQNSIERLKILPNGNIETSNDLIVGVDIECDDLTLLNINASGNVEGQTISEGGVLIEDKYAQIDGSGNVLENGNKLDDIYVKPGDTVNFTSISEGGVLLEDKYFEVSDDIPAAQVAETATKSFVTDAEKSTWNAKASVQEYTSGTFSTTGGGTGNWKAYRSGNLVTINFNRGTAPTTYEITGFSGTLPSGMRPSINVLAEIQKRASDLVDYYIVINTNGTITLYNASNKPNINGGFIHSISYAIT